jgi:hypothetical protein
VKRTSVRSALTNGALKKMRYVLLKNAKCLIKTTLQSSKNNKSGCLKLTNSIVRNVKLITITKMPRFISKNASSHVSGVLTNANKDTISKKNRFLKVI